MLAYVDHGAARGLYTNVGDLLKKIDEVKWIILSLLIYEIAENEKEKVVGKIIEKWLNITASARFVEDVYTTIIAYNNRIIKTDQELARKLVKIVSEVKHYIEDLYLMNTILKVLTGKALPDIGLLVVYENPLEVEQGRRQRPLRIRNTLLRREAEAVYESKLCKSIKRLNIEYVIVRKVVTKPQIKLIDWNCMGLYPYSPSLDSVVQGKEVAEPCLCAYLKHGVDIVSTISTTRLVLSHYRKLDNLNVVNVLKLCEEFSNINNILVLPPSMTKVHILTVKAYLQKQGVEVVSHCEVPVDILLDVCQI